MSEIKNILSKTFMKSMIYGENNEVWSKYHQSNREEIGQMVLLMNLLI